MRWACSALLGLLLAASCGGRVMSAGPRTLDFNEIAVVQSSAHAGPAMIIVGSNEASASRVVQLAHAPAPPADRVLIAVFEGAQRTGGYAIRIDRIERDGTRLVVRATFIEPGAGTVVTQVLTSPAHVVSIAKADLPGVTAAVLLDAAGTERARTDLT